MKELKEYYEKHFMVEGDPSFEELTEQQRQAISKGGGFVGFRASLAVREFGNALRLLKIEHRS